MNKKITYSSILKEISTFKNSGIMYELNSNREFVESSISGNRYSFIMNLYGFEMGTRYDIRSIKLPRKKRKKLLHMLKRRYRNLKKEIDRMYFKDEVKK